MLLATLAAGTMLLAPGPAASRYAILIGSDVGQEHEATLVYTERDLMQMRDVLTGFAGFDASHVLVLLRPTPAMVRDAFLQVRQALDGAARDSTLFVYYTGHGDANAMHLGQEVVTWDDLVASSKSVTAHTWLMVLDACRAGGITRVKGARLAASFALKHPQDALPAGFAIVTSASAGESAQESETLQGSLFTYYWVRGLRGAADKDGDGSITLSEVFRYAADHTSASSAQTLAGLQHATFLYNLRGHADLALAQVTARQLAQLAADPEGVVSTKRAAGPTSTEPRQFNWSLAASGTAAIVPLFEHMGAPWGGALQATCESPHLAGLLWDGQLRVDAARSTLTGAPAQLVRSGAFFGARYGWQLGSSVQLSAGLRVGGFWVNETIAGAKDAQVQPAVEALVQSNVALTDRLFLFGSVGGLAAWQRLSGQGSRPAFAPDAQLGIGWRLDERGAP